MSEILYSSETEAKKQELGTYFDNITNALDKINEICTSDSWQCMNGTDLDTKFETLKEKIPAIKTALVSYEDFFGVVKNTYGDASSEIDSAISTYVNE